mmetsp:Transcript_28272/g.41726  ORF Transcript_28272/g.41726 Transcript_28272/m.41726 type:complete len:87 (+) Transcript_28272:151-411(+)
MFHHVDARVSNDIQRQRIHLDADQQWFFRRENSLHFSRRLTIIRIRRQRGLARGKGHRIKTEGLLLFMVVKYHKLLLDGPSLRMVQ